MTSPLEGPGGEREWYNADEVRRQNATPAGPEWCARGRVVGMGDAVDTVRVRFGDAEWSLLTHELSRTSEVCVRCEI